MEYHCIALHDGIDVERLGDLRKGGLVWYVFALYCIVLCCIVLRDEGVVS